jgi:AcrR family transcriptional regulator
MAVNDRSAHQPRHYDSPKRRRQAGATRRRILAAAEQLFAAQGYAAVTMEAIARAAGVSLATIYLHFPGRVVLLGGLAEEFASTPEFSAEQVEQVAQGHDPLEVLRVGAHILRRLNERSWLIADILRSQRGNDPEVARLWTLWQQRHLDAVQRGIVALAQAGGLRSEMPLETATDMFYAIAGTEVYRALTQERGWSPDQYEHWLLETACRELLAYPSYKGNPVC